MRMPPKIWCLVGVHEYQTIQQGPYQKLLDGHPYRSGVYHVLQCKVCGAVKRKVMA